MDGNVFLITLTAILLLPIFFAPSIIAHRCKHTHIGVIVGLNIFGFTGFLWIIAFIWAVFPSNKSLIDPFLGNVTGTGDRNTGDTIGSVKYGVRRREEQERKTDHEANPLLGGNAETALTDFLAKIEKLYNEKIINDEEYARMRGRILEKSIRI